MFENGSFAIKIQTLNFRTANLKKCFYYFKTVYCFLLIPFELIFSGRYGFTCILKHDQILFIRDRIAQLSYFRYGQVRILWPHQRLFQAFWTKKRGRWPR